MSTKYDKFDEIYYSYVNWNISQTKSMIKALSRSDRYDLIMYHKDAFNQDIVDDFVRWIIKGEL